MKPADPLATVMEIHGVITDCFRVTQRALRSPGTISLSKTGFSARGSDTLIPRTRAEVDALLVLALWAVFERQVRDYLVGKGAGLKDGVPRPIARALAHQTQRQIEYWRTDDILDVLKSSVDPQLIGQAKQIKTYRDWVAHRNPRTPVPVQTDPAVAHTVLSRILAMLRESEVRSATRRRTRRASGPPRRASRVATAAPR